MARYENGSSLTRGEFVAHMERVDQTLEGIVERLERIEDRMNRPKIIFLSGVSVVGSKVLLVALTLLVGYITLMIGIHVDPLNPIGF